MIEMTEREQQMRSMIFALMAITIVLGGFLVWNMTQLHRLRAVAGGDYITTYDCQQLMDMASSPVGRPLNASTMPVGGVNIGALS